MVIKQRTGGQPIMIRWMSGGVEKKKERGQQEKTAGKQRTNIIDLRAKGFP